MNEVKDFSFIRIESTAVEKDDFIRILRDLDVNFLMSLAMGYECHVYDCGTRREMSKTISVAIPFIKKTLEDVWLKNIEFKADTEEKRAVKRKLRYFRRYLNTEEIKLIGHSRSTEHDGDKEYYRNLALQPHSLGH